MSSWDRLLSGNLTYPDPDLKGTRTEQYRQGDGRHEKQLAEFPLKRVREVRAMSDADLLAQCIRDKGLPISRFGREVLLCSNDAMHDWLSGKQALNIYRRRFLELSRCYTLSQRKDRRRDP